MRDIEMVDESMTGGLGMFSLHRGAGPDALPQDLAISLRALSTHEDFAACVRLQKETWGVDYADVVPGSVLQVAQKVDGIAGGAFDGSGALVGFVFGLTGMRHGRLVHWSHMLAVRPDLRNHGIGRRLKEFQRDDLLARGVDVMHWTFDPLVARNAHLNLNRLGVTVEEYVPDMYADTGSKLHRFGTDRFIVSWSLVQSSPRAMNLDSAFDALPIVEKGANPAAPRVRIEVPRDVEAMFGPRPDDALAWRQRSREAFLSYLSLGYRVEAFFSDLLRDRCFYVLRSGAGDKGDH